ncbi:leucine zipper transcription factor-like protein 1 [Littorina saxatilis]|uniref:Leucine zipper transcription factor-like protein 1 n=1 Tax=Littorina saxatilis TaxID=31220 RepID=A0AAN9AUS9_9CAEN
MTTELGVNEHHQGQVINYIRFARYQRGQRLRAVDVCFEDLKDSRLTDETFTIDEVTEMLDGLLTVVRSEVESELINTAHTNVLMMRQMFQQAEKWHLKLQADISELENRELLEQIKEFEEREFSGAKRDTEFVPKKLEPVNETGGTALLHMKIEELQAQNEQMRERLMKVDKDFAMMMANQGALSSQLALAKGAAGQGGGEDVDALMKKMAQLESEVQSQRNKGKMTAESSEKDLSSTKHELLKIREMLEMAEKELEKKVSMTTPFKNLKSMLQKKNEQLKDLRKRLGKYESCDDD